MFAFPPFPWQDPNSRSRTPSMERSAKSRRTGSAGARRLSGSSQSSTSSGILVAPGPVSASRADSQSVQTSQLPNGSSTVMAAQRVTVDVQRERNLVFKFPAGEKRDFLSKLVKGDDLNATSKYRSYHVKDDDVNQDDSEGPNHRGTYSRKYTERHPDITWIHRGQGRYKPASESKTLTTNNRFDVVNQAPASNFTSKLKQDIETFKVPTRRPTHDQQRRRSLNTPSTTVSEPAAKDRPERPSLRRLATDAQTTTTTTNDQRSARLARRAKPKPTNEIERRSSRRSSTQVYKNEDDSDSDDMAKEKPNTFTTEYVNAHKDETFYHTGNGWWKRGDRPKGRRNAKLRDAEGHATARQRDGTWEFDPDKTIHVSQLQNYEGVEFHHCGNGWYKAGGDPTGHRASRMIGNNNLSDESEDEEDDEDGGEDKYASVSREYKDAHPDIEWVHRGNGRYKMKSAVNVALASATPSSSPEPEPQLGPKRDTKVYSKAYRDAHPQYEWHHRGNARYMRGPPPEHWASSQRKRSAAAKAAAAAEAEEEDDSALYSKDYVDAHPGKEFHHRGQGRWARGPRTKSVVPSNESEESDIDPDTLVDTDYVDARPNETFHHRGQGRWARGMPPAGSSNKVAIRGPGARDKSDSANLLDEDEANRPPPMTALLVKGEGPDKWPNLVWHYRGGGKWSRMTKGDFEDAQRRGNSRKKGRMSVDGPEAQLEREAAAAEAARRGDFDGALASTEKPKAKRRRTNKRGSFQTQDDSLLSKQSSKSHSQAPTPKPRILEPEEDMLAEEDLPQLFRDDYSPPSDDIDAADRYIRDEYRPMNSGDKFVKALTKHDPQVRPAGNLKRLAANTQSVLQQLQDEFLELDKITAPHARIPRKPAKGGRAPIDTTEFEDKKEADLYDYTYNNNRVGFQDPEAQRIQRDAEGRELRNRRNRSGVPAHGTVPGWNFGEDEPLGPRRQVKQPSRFDGVIEPVRKRARNSATGTGRTSKAPSMTPDRTTTPLGGPAGYQPARGSRLALHVPKRVQEIRDESVGGVPMNRELSPSSARKGRPPGSKNLHKRRDAGVKKGPRKPKAGDGSETPMGSEIDGEM